MLFLDITCVAHTCAQRFVVAQACVGCFLQFQHGRFGYRLVRKLTWLACFVTWKVPLRLEPHSAVAVSMPCFCCTVHITGRCLCSCTTLSVNLWRQVGAYLLRRVTGVSQSVSSEALPPVLLQHAVFCCLVHITGGCLCSCTTEGRMWVPGWPGVVDGAMALEWMPRLFPPASRA